MSTSLLDVGGVQGSRMGPDVQAHLRSLLIGERPRQEALAVASDATAARLATHRDDDSILEREVAKLTAERARAAVADIDVALARMAAGGYGSCTSCGTPIGFERLEVLPHVRTCVRCQAQPPGMLR